MLSFHLNFISGGGGAENTLSAQSTEDRNLHQVDLYKQSPCWFGTELLRISKPAHNVLDVIYPAEAEAGWHSTL